jgi:hypothetical protein
VPGGVFYGEAKSVHWDKKRFTIFSPFQPMAKVSSLAERAKAHKKTDRKMYASFSMRNRY